MICRRNCENGNDGHPVNTDAQNGCRISPKNRKTNERADPNDAGYNTKDMNRVVKKPLAVRIGWVAVLELGDHLAQSEGQPPENEVKIEFGQMTSAFVKIDGGASSSK